MARQGKLDAFERGIESTIDSFVPLAGSSRHEVDQALRAARKSKNINIRISEEDLTSLRKSAEDEGIPYQTLISSILHKYLSGRLVEEKHIRKSIELLARRERGT